ncbi:MAG TPA: amidohydrolase family protein, partial [Pyrinomonadaceae bacterium]|nr:amidohydrolase family protein [Pyrinomonadaceae bacterium]
MKSLASILLALMAALSLTPPRTNFDTADIVFKNGNIYTANERQPKAEAIAVKGDRIVFVGSNRDAQKYVGGTTRVVDLRGKTLLPGMADAHQHLAGVGFREMTLNLEGTTSLADFLAKVKTRVEQAQPREWVTGRGWIETFWKPQAFPTRADLDQVAPNNPVILTRADGHASVVNSAALKVAGVDKNTPNPFGGEISKTGGEPNGMLLDAAQGLVRRHIPATSAADAERAIVLGVKRNIKLGWTQIQDAGGSYAEVELFKKLYGEGKIKLRIYKAVHGPGPASEKLLNGGAVVGAFGNRFNARTIKVVSDGALGSRGAALLAPYADASDTSGFLTVKEAELGPMLEMALRNGIQVETHA